MKLLEKSNCHPYDFDFQHLAVRIWLLLQGPGSPLDPARHQLSQRRRKPAKALTAPAAAAQPATLLEKLTRRSHVQEEPQRTELLL